MERQRSPSYPSLSLEQAIDLVAKLHKANRTNVVSRETAAKDMGYTGLTGRSLTVLAALAQYGLIERAGKGDIKVTRRSVEILHPVEEAHKTEAIKEAAESPTLFRDLRERFPDGMPSANALRSYLVQRDFNDVAIGQAIDAFLDTIAFVEKATESERSGLGADAGDDGGTKTPAQEPAMQAVQPPPTPAPPPTAGARTLMSTRQIVPNEVYLDFRGSREVHVEGLLDLNGILELEEKLKAVKMLLKAPAAGRADQPEEGERQH